MVFKFCALLKRKNLLKRSDLGKGTYTVSSSLRPYKARIYGYKSVPGNILVVSSIKKGGIEAKIPARGRTPSKIYSKYSRNISLARILKKRVQKRYTNMVCKGQYPVFEDGKRVWFEFFFQDPLVSNTLVSNRS